MQHFTLGGISIEGKIHQTSYYTYIRQCPRWGRGPALMTQLAAGFSILKLYHSVGEQPAALPSLLAISLSSCSQTTELTLCVCWLPQFWGLIPRGPGGFTLASSFPRKKNWEIKFGLPPSLSFMLKLRKPCNCSKSYSERVTEPGWVPFSPASNSLKNDYKFDDAHKALSTVPGTWK